MEASVHDMLLSELGKRPLVAVDLLVEHAREHRDRIDDERTSILGLAAAAAVASTSHKEVTSDEAYDYVLDVASPHSIRRLAAVAFLRILPGAPNLFDDTETRISALRLFDQTLASDLYVAVGIGRNDMPVEKLSKLQDAAPRAEHELANVLVGLAGLATIDGFRQTFIARTRHPLVKVVVLPFLPPGLAEPVRLNQLFEAVSIYRAAGLEELLRRYQDVHFALDRFRADARGFGTQYAVLFLAGLAERLTELIDDDFRHSPLSRPAEIEIQQSPKRYPLSETGRMIDVRLLLTKSGPGPATDVFCYVDESENIDPLESATFIGVIDEPTREVVVPCKVVLPDSAAMLSGSLVWRNVDESEGRAPFEILLEAQRQDVDWDRLKTEDPYSPEPVSTERELADRREVLRELVARATARSIGSSVIYGQKRVGKTSVARALESHVKETEGRDYKVIYLETGAFGNPDPTVTVETLGHRLCTELMRSDGRLAELSTPSFRGALAPLDEFLAQARQSISSLKVLFILDEFDELGPELARRGDVSDPFFVTIRTISGHDPFGFVLVGGENMEVVRQDHGDRLNKFEYTRLDYFDKSAHWDDYIDLVRQPVTGSVEYSEDAIHALYDATAGHPYFTKLICGEILRNVIARHDVEITAREVEEAVASAVLRLESNSFQHFWTDGFLDSPERVRAASAVRRQVLVALARALRIRSPAPAAEVAVHARQLALSRGTVEEELTDFERRGVLVREEEGYRCHVPLFERWLIGKGVDQIATTFDDRAVVERIRSEDERARVKPEEIAELLTQWDLYRGELLTEGVVRRWLNQFEKPRHERLMFKLVREMRFISAARICRELQDVHRQRILHGLRERVTGERRRSDILVSHLGSPGKSGAQYARIYAQEARVYIETNVVPPSSLPRVLEERGRHVQRLVFVDDFIGSGKQTTRNLEQLADPVLRALMHTEIRCFYIAICAFEEGKHAVSEAVERLGLPLEVVVCEPLLGDGDRCFSDHSQIFEDAAERSEAKRIAWDRGVLLAKDWPLGWDDSEALLVFSYSVPNNTLPIIWATAEGWVPLFPR